MAPDSALLGRLRPETRLLLLAAGPAAVDEELARLLRDESLDWDVLGGLAHSERATAVLWRRIRRVAPDDMPATIREEFERRAMVADFTASYIEERVGETLLKITDAGIDVVLLKGAALASGVYGSFFERPMGDIDMLVDGGHAEEAWRISQGTGWTWDPKSFPRERYEGHHHLPPLIDARGTTVKLEMHAELFMQGHPFQLSRAELLRDAREARIGGGVASVPEREKLLLHACMHFAWSHMMLFGSWRAFRDVVALSEAGLNWVRFMELAESNRAASSCYWTLRLAVRLVGAEVPQDVLARLEKACDRRWIAVVERHVLREMFQTEDVCPSQRVRRWMWETAIQPEAAGHGSVRPWILDDSLLEAKAPSASGMVRVGRQMGKLTQWVRYIWAIAGG